MLINKLSTYERQQPSQYFKDFPTVSWYPWTSDHSVELHLKSYNLGKKFQDCIQSCKGLVNCYFRGYYLTFIRGYYLTLK